MSGHAYLARPYRPALRPALMAAPRPGWPAPSMGQAEPSWLSAALDSRPLSFLVNAGATVVAFVAGQKLSGAWSTIGYVTAVVAGIRAANDFSQMTSGGA